MKNPVILIVEDEGLVADEIQARLNDLGYSLTSVANSGEEALTRIKESYPDLILMDIKLKGNMDGIEIAQLIHDWVDVPVIFITAYADEKTLARAKITEPFGYVLKPFQDKELQTSVELALFKHGMERKLKLANQELQQKATELQELNEELAQYANAISRDLVAPLNAIQNYSAFLVEDCIFDKNSIMKLYLDGINNSLKEAQSLVNDLSMLTRIEHFKTKTESLNLNKFFQTLVKEMEIPSDVQIVISEDLPCVDTNLVHLKQVFINLVDNAIKFNKSPLKVVTLGCSEDNPKHLDIYVKDNGIGIDEKDHLKIFRIFQKVHPKSEYPGTGIGLAIVKKALKNLNGTIKIESKLGEGSVFIITLPKTHLRKPLLISSSLERP
jgi:signal transduction histidine kinase